MASAECRERESGSNRLRVSASLRRLLAASRPEAGWALAGVLFAAAYGAQYPLFSLLFGRATAALQGAAGRGEVGSAVGALAAGICGVGVGAGLCVFGQYVCFSMVGERLTARLRRLAFAQLLRRRAGYFDLPGHGAPALCARLATEAAEVRGAAAERLGLLAQNGVTAVLGAGIALAASWRMGLVVLACVPLMTAGALIENRLYRGGFEALGSRKPMVPIRTFLLKIMTNNLTGSIISVQVSFFCARQPS